MIKRDQHGIVVQHNFEQPSAVPDSASGGDSAARTGVLAASGSAKDIANMPLFIKSANGADLLVRHPFMGSYANTAETSRDQVVQYCVGGGPSAASVALSYARLGWVNKDYLDPSVRFYLYKIAGVKAPLWIRLVGYPLLLASLLWNCFVKPNEELNQFTCICIVMGKFWARSLLKLHPSLEANMAAYWGGWRDQPEIANALLTALKRSAGNVKG